MSESLLNGSSGLIKFVCVGMARRVGVLTSNDHETTRQVNEELARALTHENEFSQKSEYDYTFGYFLNALKKKLNIF